MFVGVFYASCVYPFHIGKVDQGSYNGFHRFTAYSHHFLGIRWVLREFFVHSVIVFFVNAVVYLLEFGAFPTALFPQWACFATALAASIGAFGISFTVGLFAFERQ